jgi:ribosomal protein L18E
VQIFIKKKKVTEKSKAPFWKAQLSSLYSTEDRSLFIMKETYKLLKKNPRNRSKVEIYKLDT